MFLSINKLPNNIRQGDKPNPKAAQALQEGLGGQFGEMRTMMQYLFQNMNLEAMQHHTKIYLEALQQKRWVM
jgi:Mn-containing catalase